MVKAGEIKFKAPAEISEEKPEKPPFFSRQLP
jgi:hypothetical protein